MYSVIKIFNIISLKIAINEFYFLMHVIIN
uniref:Uncharacterized protein n=1 Tax=viral metagenome TaxID=1070528 RepID=A0A6C0H8N3_9ZZZZ